MEVLLKKLDAKTLLDAWKTVFKRHGIARDDAYFAGCFNENETGDRLTLLAFSESVLVGCGHLLY